MRRFHFQLNDTASRISATGLLFVFFAFFVTEDVLTQSSSFPVGNDALYDAANWFKKNTNADSIIATWWDFGYVWQSAARRATLFDGGLFTTHYLYWMAKILASSNSSIAPAVLRPVACTQQNWLVNFGEGDLNDRMQSVEKYLLSSIFEKFGDHEFDQFQQAVTGIEALYCKNPRDVFLVVTKDMLYKIGLYRSYGFWDFQAAKYRREMKNLSQSDALDYLIAEYNMSEEEATTTLYKVYEQESSPAPVQMSRLGQCKSSGEKLVCDNKFEVDVSSMDARQGRAHPKSLIVVKDGRRSQVFYNDSAGNFAVVVFDDGSDWRSLLMDVDVADTLVVRMFVGEEISHLKKEYQTKETPDRVVVYKVLLSNESLVDVSKNVTLTPVSAELFFQDLLSNVARGDNEFFMHTLQDYVSVNSSSMFKTVGVRKAFIDASQYTNITVQFFEDEMQRRIRLMMSGSVPLDAISGGFMFDYFYQNVSNKNVTAMLSTLQQFSSVNVSQATQELKSHHAAFVLGSSHTNITVQEYVDELRKNAGKTIDS